MSFEIPSTWSVSSHWCQPQVDVIPSLSLYLNWIPSKQNRINTWYMIVHCIIHYIEKTKKSTKKYYSIISWSLLLMNIVSKWPFSFVKDSLFHSHKCTRTESGYPSPRSLRTKLACPWEMFCSYPCICRQNKKLRADIGRLPALVTGCPNPGGLTRRPHHFHVGGVAQNVEIVWTGNARFPLESRSCPSHVPNAFPMASQVNVESGCQVTS